MRHILPDVNVLLAAFRADHEYHHVCRPWLEHTLGSDNAFGVSELTLGACVRIATSPLALRDPSTLDEALAFADAVLRPAHAVRVSRTSGGGGRSRRKLPARMTDQPPGHLALRALWNDLAKHDALWAVLAFDDKQNRAWDLREFMKIGEREIALAVHHFAELGFPVGTTRALDFGCGVGRLTQALARRFDHAIGVDISDEMVRLATAVNHYGNRASYLRIDDAGLGMFGNCEFDFLYSAMVLQHTPPASTVEYLRDFIRILRPGGLTAFQLTSHRVEHWIGETKPMVDHAYRARLELRSALPQDVTGGVPLRILVTVTNASDVAWVQKDIGSLRIGNHWLDHTGELMVAQDDGRSAMPQVVAPGAAFDVDLVVTPPSTPGQYVLELDVVHEAVSWFAGKGSATHTELVSVTADAGVRTATHEVIEFPVPEYQMAESPADRGATSAPAPREFPMYGVPKEVVIATVRDAGGEIVDIEDDPRAGHDWLAFRYFVRKR